MKAKFTEFKTSFAEGAFPAHIQEEYLVNGSFDIPYMSFKYKIPCSKHKGNDMINSMFGTVKFATKENENEVSKEQFQEYYKFGVYRNVRGWISHLHAHTGDLLTKAKLFEYLIDEKITG